MQLKITTELPLRKEIRPPVGSIHEIADIPYNLGVNAYASSTEWYNGGDNKNGEIRFIRGRLKFGKIKNAAPFPSMVVVFKST